MNKRTKSFLSFLLRALLAIVFIVAALLIILSASGYRLQIAQRKVVQTAMVVVKALPRDTQVILDGEVQNSSSSTLWRITNLEAGKHEVAVKKDGYITWGHQTVLEPGQTALYQDVLLFLQKPNIEIVSENDQSGLIARLKQSKPETRIIIKNNELYLDDIFVSRFLSTVTNPQLLADEAHISYITNNKFHVIDIDGTNDVELFGIPDNSPYILLNGSSQVLFQDGTTLKTATIR